MRSGLEVGGGEQRGHVVQRVGGRSSGMIRGAGDPDPEMLYSFP